MGGVRQVSCLYSGPMSIEVMTVNAVVVQVSACEMVNELAADLQESFFPYVERVTPALVHLLSTCRHEDVVSYCLVALPQLIRATGKSTKPDRQHVVQLTRFVVEHMIKVGPSNKQDCRGRTECSTTP